MHGFFWSPPFSSIRLSLRGVVVLQISSVVWLAFMSEGMMTGAETCGCIFGVPEAVMGLTATAGNARI